MCKYYKFALALSQHLPNVSDSDSEHAPEGKLVIQGESDDGDITIKFFRWYSKDAHEMCAQLGFAPKLRASTKISGDWYMVVLDNISDEYEVLDGVLYSIADEAGEKFTIEVQEKVKVLGLFMLTSGE